jgi:hypothetical protein
MKLGYWGRLQASASCVSAKVIEDSALWSCRVTYSQRNINVFCMQGPMRSECVHDRSLGNGVASNSCQRSAERVSAVHSEFQSCLMTSCPFPLFLAVQSLESPIEPNTSLQPNNSPLLPTDFLRVVVYEAFS